MAKKTDGSMLAREKIKDENIINAKKNVDAVKILKNVDAIQVANPGCKERKLRKYKALDEG